MDYNSEQIPVSWLWSGFSAKLEAWCRCAAEGMYFNMLETGQGGAELETPREADKITEQGKEDEDEEQRFLPFLTFFDGCFFLMNLAAS